MLAAARLRQKITGKLCASSRLVLDQLLMLSRALPAVCVTFALLRLVFGSHSREGSAGEMLPYSGSFAACS